MGSRVFFPNTHGCSGLQRTSTVGGVPLLWASYDSEVPYRIQYSLEEGLLRVLTAVLPEWIPSR
jgi:hypothetical protein